ncbi:MAG: N-6 DNA methylase [Gammaproteobacteria bacterium]|nr:N-6 DNA methylase [Gammaproteobacteria bacterium]
MDSENTPTGWALEFGLAQSPLFERREIDVGGEHYVLLDGGYGSFALSVSAERLWTDHHTAADWSWSCNLPHHVTVTDREVGVVRWDKHRVASFTRASVERQREDFYEYLTTDLVKSNQRVIEHMLGIFRSLRSLLAGSSVDDDLSVEAFLALITRAMERRDGLGAKEQATHSEGESVLQSLPTGQADALLEVLQTPNLAGLRAHPALAVRHAGSDIFQEAHFELVRVHGADLFGYAQPAESARVTRGGAHFTPAALARTLAEQALLRVPDLRNRQTLTVMDPACGSGGFLHEALRTLRRIGFVGKVRLVGRDISRPAVAMAQFVLANAASDWSPDGGCEVDVMQADSLATPLPSADVILMNPPFISWLALAARQREHMQEVLGGLMTGRGDYSMAFVVRALETLADGGVVGTLLPSSLFVLNAASKWRQHLLDMAEVEFVAAMGDYGLFPYAQVQVAVAVFSKPRRPRDFTQSVAVLVTDNDHHATGNALRGLRKAGVSGETFLEGGDWRLFRVPARELRDRPTWRLVPQQTMAAIGRLFDVGDALPASELFDIHQGVRTGMNPAFLLSEAQLEGLPRRERKWFKPAVTNKALTQGTIVPDRFVFHPYDKNGLVIDTEEKLVEELPEYWNAYLEPNRGRLLRRKSLRGRTDWWGLSWPRAWSPSSQPRIVSKYFGGSGGFAADLEAVHVVVQGYAWFPKWEVPAGISKAHEGEPVKDLLAAYVAIMNSTPFQRLLRVFSPHVAGGQFDLSPRYVKHVPLPNLPVLMADERAGGAVSTLADLVLGESRMDGGSSRVADDLTGQLYGLEVFEHL